MANTKKLPAHLRTFKLTARERQQLAERDALIRILGLAPEDRSSADTRYAMTTGEFRREAMLDGLLPPGACLADQLAAVADGWPGYVQAGDE